MLVEAADHHLDEVSFNESSCAGNGAFTVRDTIKHGDTALAGFDDFRILSETVVLELNPRSVLLLEDNLVSEDRCLNSGDWLFPSDLNVSANELNYGGLDSVGTSSGSEGEDLREV